MARWRLRRNPEAAQRALVGIVVMTMSGSLGCGLLGPRPTPEAQWTDALRRAPGLDCVQDAPSSERRAKVLLVGIDGLRSDALAAAHTPNLDALAASGRFSARMRTVDYPKSGPGWATVFTGVWRDKHGVDSNRFFCNRLHDYPSFLERMEELTPELRTAWIHSWSGLERITRAADLQRYCEPRNGDDRCAVDSARSLLETREIDFAFVYFVAADDAGHRFGFHPDVEPYTNAIATIDAQFGELLAALDRRCTRARESWLIVVLTDHGGGGRDLREHGYPLPVEREVPLILRVDGDCRLAGSAIEQPMAQVDVAPTIMRHLGIHARSEWELDGRALSICDDP